MKDIYDRITYRDENGQLQVSEDGCIPVPERLRTIAYAWHGGQGSALYSMASVGSIASYRHQQALLYELRDSFRSLITHMGEFDDAPQDQDDLEDLIRYVKEAPFAADDYEDEDCAGSSGGRF